MRGFSLANSLLFSGLLSLAACGGGSSGNPQGGSSGTPNGGNSGSQEEFFQTRLQTASGFCRTCHLPGGVADTADGDGLMLSSNAADDFRLLRASWETLGGGVETSPLLIEPSDPSEPHSGGKPWPAGSQPYEAMRTLLACWDSPDSCSLSGGVSGPAPNLEPLLGSARGGHVWFDYCGADDNGNPRPDSALLPPDPRSLVQPGISNGKAVAFNAFWKDCHIDPELVGERPHPETCGQLRESYAKGAPIMEGNGQLGAATTFAGQQPHGLSAISADQYNMMWLLWGLPGRPDNFDQLVAERHGFGPVLSGPDAPRNPYPLQGEDPNLSNGGSGTLPQGLTQTRNNDGSYSGYIAANCQGCHSTPVETADGLDYHYGAGGGLLDASTSARDFGALGGAGTLIIDRAGFGGRVRGTNNAQFANVLALLGSFENPDPISFGQILNNGSTATGDTPAWWNVGHRPVKFVDAMFSGDAVRVDFALYYPLLDKNPLIDGEAPGIFDMERVDQWMSENVQYGDHWIMAQKSPEYPGEINEPLAEQGAVLFHTKNLWTGNINNTVQQPAEGNGSCAGCHGAYSPRYVNDTSYLASPALEGMASYITPIDIIDTDRVRLDTFNEGTNQGLSGTFVGYPETADTAQDCRVQNMESLRNGRPKGYAAPPLYGVWATAPYLHNGSVPTVAAVLDSTSRPAIWRRVSKPARADQQGQVVMGFDYNFERAYDQQNIGWDYEELECGGDNTLPYLDCTPLDPLVDTILQIPVNSLFSNLLLSWNITNPPILSNQDVESRKIYNTAMFSQGNGGHVFSDVLNDAERKAIIEYLKTL
ncbi:hypothetical protein [uncultured Zhongshania sp.]|uniref:c-type cytochrome n=1 Tax=uncultured Zhongshania sp. TaxID=1642288 RepID=UPI0025FAF6F2|nr:hypothetical protein [uncultured Zhongshania sp.]